ncbi:MAG TPA: fructose 1,6-bisphosphatase, partial [Methanobacteriaceae archaeon]|nr:fructose 1,6-bisphosphatase [Methanobacteriaceae archaeon]
MKTTVSVIKADVGSIAGHGLAHPALLEKCKEILGKAKEEGLLEDFYVTNCGDDTELIMTHRNGEENEEIHE